MDALCVPAPSRGMTHAETMHMNMQTARDTGHAANQMICAASIDDTFVASVRLTTETLPAKNHIGVSAVTKDAVG